MATRVIKNMLELERLKVLYEHTHLAEAEATKEDLIKLTAKYLFVTDFT